MSSFLIVVILFPNFTTQCLEMVILPSAPCHIYDVIRLIINEYTQIYETLYFIEKQYKITDRTSCFYSPTQPTADSHARPLVGAAHEQIVPYTNIHTYMTSPFL